MKKDMPAATSRKTMYIALAILFTLAVLPLCTKAQNSIDSLSIRMSNDTVFVNCQYQSNLPNIVYFKCSPNGFNGPSVFSLFVLESPGVYVRNYIFTNMIPGKSYCVRAVLTDTIGSSSSGGGGQILDFTDACLPITTGIEESVVAPEDRVIDFVYDLSGKLVNSAYLKTGYYIVSFHSSKNPRLQKRGKLLVADTFKYID